jgi:Synergist-CTERM protein sorting domain-containing protein
MNRRLTLLACLACAPALAMAQTITVTESNDQDKIVNIAECQNQPPDRLAFVWTPTTTSTAYDLYVSDQASCPPPGQTVNGVSTNAHTGSVATGILQTSLNQGDTAATLLNLAQISCLSSSSSLFVCVFATGTTTNAVATGTVQLDLVTPPAPTLNSVSPGDGSLNASWTVGSGSADAGTSGSANSFRVHYVPTDGSAPDRYATFTGAGTTSGRVTGLTNGVEYTVTVTALTIGSNESPRSNSLAGTPIPIEDFWRLYHDVNGGRDQGGCATGAAGLAALAALAPLVLRRRRSRK